MSIKVKDIMKIMDEFAPTSKAEQWDNCGLIVGDPDKDVNKILLALDPSNEIIDSAVKNDIDLIITHHPLTIKQFNKVNTKSNEGRKIIKLIKNNISLYSAHTNLDQVNNGINDILAKKLGINNTKMLIKTKSSKLYKLVVYVPETHLENVRKALGDFGAGYIGNYSNCFFYAEGTGTFLPEDKSNPFIGKQGVLEKVKEYRLETIIEEEKLKGAIEVMINAHPYEEVAYDIYETKNESQAIGFGRYGFLNKEISFKEYIKFVKSALNLPYLRYVGDLNKNIKKVAVCSGSGMSFVKEAIKVGADLFVTGDIKHHDALDAKEAGILLIDASHYGTEVIVTELLNNYLKEKIKDIDIVIELSDDPIKII